MKNIPSDMGKVRDEWIADLLVVHGGSSLDRSRKLKENQWERASVRSGSFVN